MDIFGKNVDIFGNTARADMAGLGEIQHGRIWPDWGKYSTGGYGQIGVHRDRQWKAVEAMLLRPYSRQSRLPLLCFLCHYYPPKVSSMKYCCLGVIRKEYFRLVINSATRKND